MSNIRDLKKDIDFLFYEIIDDCFVYSEMHPDIKSDELSALISDAVDFRNELITRVNNPEATDDPKKVKAYFKAVKADLVTGADELFTRLSGMAAPQD
jgi:hypothetical protein